MNKFILTTLCLCYMFIGKAQNEAKISGKITNPTGKSVYLFSTSIEKGKRVITYLDSTSVNSNGEFLLNAKIKKDTEATFSDGNESMNLLLSPGDDMSMSLNTKFFDETMRFSGKGSEKNNALVSLYLIDEVNNTMLFTLADSDNADTTSIFSQFNKKHDEYTSLINDYVNTIPGFKSRGEKMLEEEKTKVTQIKNYIKSDIEFKNSIKSLVGKTAIDFEGVNLKGEKTKLSDYKGKIIVVDFWATWCGPCKAEFPAYKALEEKYGADIHFVSVGVYCKEGEWNKMASDEGFKNNIFLSKEAEEQIAEYRVNFIPRYLVIDENFVLIDANAPRPSSGALENYWIK